MSMLVVVVTSGAVLMAADSRQSPSGKDTIQKLFLVGGRAVLGHSGIGVLPFDNPQNGAWDAAVEAEGVSKRVHGGDARSQFDFIRLELLKSFNNGLARRSLEIGGDSPKLAIMFINRDSDGRVFLAREELKVVSKPLGNNKWRHHAEAGGTQILIDGQRADRGLWWDVPPECPARERRPAAPTPVAISAFINAVARQSPICTQKIGGLIRVATIDDVGARWLQE
jgi:hypothetical protein